MLCIIASTTVYVITGNGNSTDSFISKIVSPKFKRSESIAIKLVDLAPITWCFSADFVRALISN